LTFLFAATPSLIAALTLKDKKGIVAFGAPVTLLTAAAMLLQDGPHRLWAAAAIVGTAGLFMLHCAIARRRLQD
jgi:hypothetical protein